MSTYSFMFSLFFSEKKYTKSSYEELLNIFLLAFIWFNALSTHNLLCYTE